jgi:hypothetical protein
MYGVFGSIVCDCCGAVVNNVDYITVKNVNGILHYCNEECKTKHGK